MTDTRNRTTKSLVPLLLVALSGLAVPAAAQTEASAHVWTLMSVRGGAGSSSLWRWTADSLVGTRDGADRLDLLRSQLTVSFDLHKQAAVGVGYAYSTTFRQNGSSGDHRLIQQFRWRVSSRPGVALKSTLEERFGAGRGTTWRAGQQGRVTIPLSGKGLSAVVSDEIIVRLGRTGDALRQFDNRAFVGIAHGLTPRSQVEVGYMHAHARRSAGSHTSHILVVALSVSR